MRNKVIRSQPRMHNVTRIPSASSLMPRLRKAIETEANHFGVSMSFVMAVAIAEALGVSLDYDYRYPNKKLKRR